MPQNCSTGGKSCKIYAIFTMFSSSDVPFLHVQYGVYFATFSTCATILRHSSKTYEYINNGSSLDYTLFEYCNNSTAYEIKKQNTSSIKKTQICL
jgi:hypothetical protein